MNERIINELVEKAITQNESDWPQIRKHLTGSGALYLHVFAETLAELIVQECLSKVDASHPLEERSEWGQNSFIEQTIKRKIKEHFGVEE